MENKFNFKVKHKDGTTYDMSEEGIWIQDFHISSPDIETETQKLRRRERIRRRRHSSRDVTIEMLLEANTPKELDDFKHLIYRIFSTEEEMELIRDITPDKRIFVVQEQVYGFDSITCADSEATINLIMYDPYIYSLEKEITTNTSEVTHFIGGDESTDWISETIFTSNTNRYVLGINDGTIIVNFEFKTGDKLEIDYRKRKITLNDLRLDVGLSLESIWEELNDGNNKIKATHKTSIYYSTRSY